MTDSTENTTPQSSFSCLYLFSFVLRDTEKSEFLDLLDFGGGEISAECHKDEFVHLHE